MYVAFLFAISMFVRHLRKQDDAIYSRLLSRTVQTRGLDGAKAVVFERTWFVMAGCVVGLSLLAPPYALSKAVLNWSELDWHDVAGCTSGMLVGPIFLCDFYFLLRRRLADRA